MSFKIDDMGRTELFFYAASGDLKAVENVIFSLAGTGMCPQRLSMIAHKDKNGKTAAEVADENGHLEISRLLNSEQGRMEYFG